MPRPPLPKITAHSLALRARSLRALLESVREKYPNDWRELVDAARGGGADVEAINKRIEAWLRARRLLDEPEKLARAVALKLLLEERGRTSDLFGLISLWAQIEEIAPLVDFAFHHGLPKPVILHFEFKFGADEDDDIRDSLFWMSGINFSEIREKILADFTEKLDAALAEYRRNCDAAGLAEAAASAVEKERLELLAEYLIERRSIADLADARRQRSDARIRADLKAAAGACGLRLRARGRPVQQKTAHKTRK